MNNLNKNRFLSISNLKLLLLVFYLLFFIPLNAQGKNKKEENILKKAPSVSKINSLKKQILEKAKLISSKLGFSNPEKMAHHKDIKQEMYPYLEPGGGIVGAIERKSICLKCDKSIQRGEVLMYYDQNNSNELSVGRVFGLPGDKIEIKAGEVYINSEKEKLIEIKSKSVKKGPKFFGAKIQKNFYFISKKRVKNKNINLKEIIIPTNSLFFLPDNRAKFFPTSNIYAIPLKHVAAREIELSKSTNLQKMLKRIKRYKKLGTF